MKKIKLGITGCLGRMGKQLIKSSKKNKKFKLTTLTEIGIHNKTINGIKIQNSMLNNSILIVHTEDVFDNYSTLLPLNDNIKLTNLNNKIVKFVE